MTCTSVCPNEALKVSFGSDMSRQDYLRVSKKQGNGSDRTEVN